MYLKARSALARAFCVASAMAIALVSTPSAYGQILYGSIVGNVRDQSGAAVPSASVTITNKETSQVRTTTTNDEGGYNIPNVQSGTYDAVSYTHLTLPTILRV